MTLFFILDFQRKYKNDSLYKGKCVSNWGVFSKWTLVLCVTVWDMFYCKPDLRFDFRRVTLRFIKIRS